MRWTQIFKYDDFSSKKPFYLITSLLILKLIFFISGSVFAVVALVHLLRIINQSPVIVGTWSIPMAGSVIGLLVAGILSYCGFTLMCKEKRT